MRIQAPAVNNVDYKLTCDVDVVANGAYFFRMPTDRRILA